MQPPQSSIEEQQDIQITAEEAKRLEECFKDKTFRDLLSDYVKEISNPKTKLAYEEYLKQVENEGGAPQNRQLMKPIPIFCIKAKTIICGDGDKKQIFINCCSGKLVKDAILGKSNGFDHPLNCSGSKQAGLCWQIPYILGLKRFDPADGSIIYDIAFSVKTIELTRQYKAFKNTVIQTAVEAVDDVLDHNQYKLYRNHAKSGKKYNKILKTHHCKGNIEPPFMSVFIDDGKGKRMVNPDKEIKKIKEKKEMKYKIIESADKNIASCWSDHNLLIEPLKRPKQIYILIKLDKISSIKDIDCKLDTKDNKQFVIINVKNNSYQACNIDLSKYDIISSSMNASWYRNKKELKITFDIKPLTHSQINNMKQKYSNLVNKKTEKEDDIIPIIKDKNNEYMLKEVETKRIMDDDKLDDHKKDDDDNLNEIPLCHHKLAMKRVNVNDNGINHKKSYWVCCKPADEKCTAFKWDKLNRNKPLKQFEMEKREKLDKIVLLIRIRNIIASSTNIKFNKTGTIDIQFETHEYEYNQQIQVDNCCIDIDKSRFDVNCRNLLIMVIKQKQQNGSIQENIDNCVDDILNDSVLFEID